MGGHPASTTGSGGPRITRVNIVVLPVGSWGDVQPFVALAAGLRRRGHRVTVATHEPFRGYVSDCALTFRSVAGDVRAAMESEEMLDVLEAGGRPLPMLARLGAAGRPHLGQVVRDQWEASQGADVLVASPWSASAALYFSRWLDIRLVVGSVYPLGPTRAHESILFAPAPRWARPFRGAYHTASHHLGRLLVWHGGRRDLVRALQGVAPGARISLREPLWQAERRHPFPILCGYSERVLGRPDDWGPQRQITGFWTLAHEPGWRAPPGLEDFLAAGPPPVLVGFGSMGTRDPASLTRLVLDALARTGRRAVLLESWRGLAEIALGEAGGEVDRAGGPQIFFVRSLPYDWILPQVTAFVHHGGAGAVSAAVRAGVPSIVVPSICDQRFWARRLHALGVAVAPIPRVELTAQRLAAALQQAHEAAIVERARALAEALRLEDGITRAAEILERLPLC